MTRYARDSHAMVAGFDKLPVGTNPRVHIMRIQCQMISVKFASCFIHSLIYTANVADQCLEPG